VPASIHIAAGTPVRAMRGGIGASFHAVSADLPGLKPAGDSWSGSESGGNPDADDDKHWDELFKHAEWLGMDWCRVELEQRMYEPERRAFDWDNAEMRVLYRILDWAERRNVDVFLQQMWADVAWNAYPGNAEDPIRRLRSAPYSISEWAYGLGELVEHLMKTKGYTCIKWVSVNNEPGHDDFSWWQDSDMKSLPITPGLKAAREEFDRRGLDVAISGPDWTDLPKLDPAAVNFDSYIGAYDLHSYGAVFDSLNGAGDGSLTQAEARMAEWANWAHRRNKPFFLSEFGTMCYGWGHWDEGPACYQSGLKNASLVVRGINAGVDGFNRWSFTNRGDLDGQWQLVRTWDVQQNKLLDSFTPQPNAYYQFAMLSRFMPKHSGVLATRVSAPFLPEDRKIVATALRTAKGNLTVLVVNESSFAADVNVQMDGLAAPVRLQRYSLTKDAEDKCAVELRPERSIDVSQQLVDRVAPMSIVVYSTYSLNAQDPGMIAE
ncbi:MAG: cellulase family glycosylhydrolase, partial [Acidobacteriaceae bacterium]